MENKIDSPCKIEYYLHGEFFAPGSGGSRAKALLKDEDCVPWRDKGLKDEAYEYRRE